MTEWTEDWVRGTVGWKAFKDGKALLAKGVVTSFQKRENICQAVIKEGRTSMRTTVKVAGTTDIRVQCGCIENRATGMVCTHAVAVLLAALRPASATVAKPVAAVPSSAPAAKSATKQPQASLVKPPAPLVAWKVLLSPRFVDELAGGRLSVRLVEEEGGTVTAADRRISEWLPYAAHQKTHALQVAGPLLGSFLDSAIDHPRIFREGNERAPVTISPDPAPALEVEDSSMESNRVHLRIAPTRGRLFEWGGLPALASDSGLQRLPVSIEDFKWMENARQLVASNTLVLPADQFLADYDLWSDLLLPSPQGWLGTLKLASEPPAFRISLDGSLSRMTAVLQVEYPGCRVVPLPGPEEKIPGLPRLSGKDILLGRQIESEKQAARRLRLMGFDATEGNGKFELRDEDRISAFLADDLRTLSSDWGIHLSDRLKEALKGIKVIRPVVQKVGGQGTSLSFELSFQTNDGTKIPTAEIRRLLGGSRRNGRAPGSAQLLLSRDCEEVIGPLVSEFGIGRLDEPFALNGAKAIAFDNVRKFLSKRTDSKDDELHFDAIDFSGIQASLRPYQTHGASWLIQRLDQLKGALLADEMGLGKTLQTIAAINHFKQAQSSGRPSLVLVPTSLVGNWSAEIKRFAPALEVLVLHGASRDKLRPKVKESDVVITSYGTLVRDLAFHLSQEYDLIIADEASVLRNATTDIAKSLYKLNAQARLALTGTPIENRVRDLWSLFRFIAPGYLGTQTEFQERYEPRQGEDTPPGALQRLRLRISPFVLRRTKEEVAGDLPEKIEIDEWLDMEGEQAKLYSGLAKAGLAEIDRLREKQGESAGRMHLLTLLLRLRQICVDPALIQAPDDAGKTSQATVKIDRLKELLQERFEEGGKTLVFSQFASNLRNIKKRLESAFGTVFLLDGSTSNRADLVTQFQNLDGPAVFLISIKAGGYGLNLTAADTVIHLDPWWNPAVEAQATDRAHRIGQTKPVTVYRLLTRGTVEERVRRMQDHKRAIIQATTGDSEEPANWSMDDLEGLLR